jgi:hypothetical protein
MVRRKKERCGIGGVLAPTLQTSFPRIRGREKVGLAVLSAPFGGLAQRTGGATGPTAPAFASFGVAEGQPSLPKNHSDKIAGLNSTI